MQGTKKVYFHQDRSTLSLKRLNNSDYKNLARIQELYVIDLNNKMKMK